MQPLKKGDIIGVMAPSSVVNVDNIHQAKSFLEGQGYQVKIHPQTYLQYGNHAGTNEDKIAALHDLFLDSGVKAIFCGRGGNGLLQYVDQLDYDLIRQNPKAVIGFSDVTVLHHALLNKAELVSFHGPIFQYMQDTDTLGADSFAALSLLSGEYQKDLFGLQANKVEIVCAGKAQGRLIGGNLTLLSELTKTSEFSPQFVDNLVFFEDTIDYAYKHDRLLAGLFLNGQFRQAAGFVIGALPIDPDLEAGDLKHPRHTVAELIQFYLNKYNLDVPVVVNAPIAHGHPNQIIPQGVTAELDATTKRPSLKLLESPFLK